MNLSKSFSYQTSSVQPLRFLPFGSLPSFTSRSKVALETLTYPHAYALLIGSSLLAI